MVLTVSQLNHSVAELLKDTFDLTWVTGEISNLTIAASGHCYFSLKDGKTQVRCAMFRMVAMRTGFKPKHGMQVIIRARVGLYEARGDFQLVAEHMELFGEGELQQQYERLKKQLSSEGLFDAEHKQPIPQLPKHIGIITSPTSAAVRDVLIILNQRFPSIPVIIYPTLVQGTQATEQIVDAIELANNRGECDVLLLIRGGGSLEDLWAFNTEPVARAVFDSDIPIISGIGHETDIALTDFVADNRAPTPSGAAEMASPDQHAWLNTFQSHETRLQQQIKQRLEQKSQQLDWLQRHLQRCHPGHKIALAKQRLQNCQNTLQHLAQTSLTKAKTQLIQANNNLQQLNPSQRIQKHQQTLVQLAQRFTHQQQLQQSKQQDRLAQAAAKLHMLSPLATLDRGYTLVTDERQKLISKAADCSPGKTITTRFQDGSINSVVQPTETAE